jgi:hypothetical protein
MLRGLAFGLLLALAACAQSNGAMQGAGPVHSAKPPSDHAFIGSVEDTEGKDVHVGISAAVLGDAAGDGRLTALFGLEMLGAIADAKPARSGASGDGASVARPITFNPAPGRDALKAAMNDLACRYPARSDISAYLLRSPSRAYPLYAVFDTDAGPGALYYDVTSWAETLKNAY